jgi:hypothetical protein
MISASNPGAISFSQCFQQLFFRFDRPDKHHRLVFDLMDSLTMWVAEEPDH